jgi:threonine dehydratase
MAFCCRHFGVRGVIYMPVTTPQQKVDKTRIFGGDSIEVRLVGDYFDQTLAAAQSYCTDVTGHFLSPFDDPDVVEGQSAVGAELLDQMPTPPDLIVAPVGGGGLSAGLMGYMAKAAPKTRFHLVEPQGGASLSAALAMRGLTTLPRVDSFVDGAAVARIGEVPWQTLQHVKPTQVSTISEDRLCLTILEMLNIEGIVLDPAGALSVDALQDIVVAGKTICCITTGGNFDFERLPEVRVRAARAAGTQKYFIVRMPQRPGALRDFLELLGPNDNITRFEYLKKSARNFGSILLGIETTHHDNFAQLTDRMEAAGLAYTDITNDEVIAQFIV